MTMTFHYVAYLLSYLCNGNAFCHCWF